MKINKCNTTCVQLYTSVHKLHGPLSVNLSQSEPLTRCRIPKEERNRGNASQHGKGSHARSLLSVIPRGKTENSSSEVSDKPGHLFSPPSQYCAQS